MFNQISTDNIRHLLEYLTIQESRSLFQACGYSIKLFNKKIKSLCFKPRQNSMMMWLRLQCKNRIYNFNKYSFNPYQRVHSTIRLRGDYMYVSATCPCCNQRNVFKFNNIGEIKKLLDPNTLPTPRYITDEYILTGYFQTLPEEIFNVGHIIDALAIDKRYKVSYWRQAIITSVNSTHVYIRYLRWGNTDIIKKTSQRLAIHGTHTKPWIDDSYYSFSFGVTPNGIPLTESNWNKSGDPVFLQIRNGRELHLLDFSLLNK